MAIRSAEMNQFPPPRWNWLESAGTIVGPYVPLSNLGTCTRLPCLLQGGQGYVSPDLGLSQAVWHGIGRRWGRPEGLARIVVMTQAFKLLHQFGGRIPIVRFALGAFMACQMASLLVTVGMTCSDYSQDNAGGTEAFGDALAEVICMAGECVIGGMWGSRARVARPRETLGDALAQPALAFSALTGMPVLMAAADSGARRALYGAMERLRDGGKLPRDMHDSEFGRFVDFLAGRMGALPAEHHGGFARDVGRHLDAFWSEFRGSHPAPAVRPAVVTAQAARSSSTDERWLLDLLEPERLSERLRQRRGEDVDTILGRGLDPMRAAIRDVMDGVMDIKSDAATATMPYRYASLWRWLYEGADSPVRGRSNLNIFGVGIGAQSIPRPIRFRPSRHKRCDWYQDAVARGLKKNDPLPLDLTMRAVAGGERFRTSWVIAEPVEAKALLAGDGTARYIDIKDIPVTVARQSVREGRIVTMGLEGEWGILQALKVIDERVQGGGGSFQRFADSLAVLPDAYRQTMTSSADDIRWVVGRMRELGVNFRENPINTFGTGPTSELTFPRGLIQGLEAERGDIVFHPLPAGTADLALMLTTSVYIEGRPGPLTAMALARLAGVTKPGGLLAVTNARLGPLDGAEGRILEALGFRHLKTIPTTETGKAVDVYQRPLEDSPLFTRVARLIDDVLAALGSS